MTAPNPLHRLATGLLLAAPAIAFYVVLLETAVNVPYLDDYDTILRFFEGERSISELLAPHVEHRLAGVRIVSGATLALTGEIDFRLLALVGNLGVFATAFVLYLSFRPKAGRPGKALAFVPASWFLFQPQYWDSFFWATSALSNLWVLPISGLAFIALLHRGPVMVTIAMALAAVAALTQANGLLCLPLGLVLLAFQRRGRATGFWIAFGLALGGLYASGLALPDGHPGSLAALGRGPVILYALNFLGAAGGFGIPSVSTAVGLAIAVSAVVLAPSAMARNPALYALLLLVAASAVLNGLGREFISGPDYALGATRYRFYGSAALAITYLLWVEGLGGDRMRRAFVGCGIAAAVAFGIASFALGVDRARTVSTRLERGMDHWPHSNRGLAHPDGKNAHDIVGRAVSAGIYRPPQASHEPRTPE